MEESIYWRKEEVKVGILTYHRSINYGAVVQAFALSQRLKELENVEVEIIDYMSARMDRYYKLFTVYRGKNGFFRVLDRISMYKAFMEGMKYLPLSKDRLVSDDINSFFKYIDGKYDAIVVGSDAVWNYEKRGIPNPYFLPGDMNVHRVSYAASCNGIKYCNLDSSKRVIIGECLRKFEYLGVRDCLTERVVNESLTVRRTVHNCDPTFLLDFDKDGLNQEFVQSLIYKLQKKYNWDTSKKHIGLMLSNLNGDIARVLVKRLKEKYKDEYEIVALYSYCKDADIPYIADLTPLEWSRIFSLFDITFSKYFHGTLLSIINGTPVISLSAEEEMDNIPAKVEDVLTRLDLMEFYYPAKNATDIEWDSFMEAIDSLIKNPPIEKMRIAVEQEKESAEDFFKYIKTIR